MSGTAILVAYVVFWAVAIVSIAVLPNWVKGKMGINWDYDRLINTLIDGDMFSLEDNHTIAAGALRVWVSNYPYSFGHPYRCGIAETLKISNRTKRRLKKYIERKSVLSALEKVKDAANG